MQSLNKWQRAQGLWSLMPLAVLPETWKFPPWSSRTTWFLPAPSLALQSTQKLASLCLLWIPYLPNLARIHFGCLPQKPNCRKQEKDKRKDCLEKRMAQYQQTFSYFWQLPKHRSKGHGSLNTHFNRGFTRSIFVNHYKANISAGGDETF